MKKKSASIYTGCAFLLCVMAGFGCSDSGTGDMDKAYDRAVEAIVAGNESKKTDLVPRLSCHNKTDNGWYQPVILNDFAASDITRISIISSSTERGVGREISRMEIEKKNPDEVAKSSTVNFSLEELRAPERRSDLYRYYTVADTRNITDSLQQWQIAEIWAKIKEGLLKDISEETFDLPVTIQPVQIPRPEPVIKYTGPGKIYLEIPFALKAKDERLLWFVIQVNELEFSDFSWQNLIAEIKVKLVTPLIIDNSYVLREPEVSFGGDDNSLLIIEGGLAALIREMDLGEGFGLRGLENIEGHFSIILSLTQGSISSVDAALKGRITLDTPFLKVPFNKAIDKIRIKFFLDHRNGENSLYCHLTEPNNGRKSTIEVSFGEDISESPLLDRVFQFALAKKTVKELVGTEIPAVRTLLSLVDPTQGWLVPAIYAGDALITDLRGDAPFGEALLASLLLSYSDIVFDVAEMYLEMEDVKGEIFDRMAGNEIESSMVEVTE